VRDIGPITPLRALNILCYNNIAEPLHREHWICRKIHLPGKCNI